MGRHLVRALMMSAILMIFVGITQSLLTQWDLFEKRLPEDSEEEPPATSSPARPREDQGDVDAQVKEATDREILELVQEEGAYPLQALTGEAGPLGENGKAAGGASKDSKTGGAEEGSASDDGLSEAEMEALRCRELRRELAAKAEVLRARIAELDSAHRAASKRRDYIPLFRKEKDLDPQEIEEIQRRRKQAEAERIQRKRALAKDLREARLQLNSLRRDRRILEQNIDGEKVRRVLAKYRGGGPD